MTARIVAFIAGFACSVCAAQPLQMRASDILGREVRTPEGERATIRDLVIDPATGKVAYFAVGRPGDTTPEAWRLYPVGALRSVAEGLVFAPTPPSSAEPPASAGASARAP